jgi:cobalt-precorrin-5B (C1)-methyltransferase
MEDPVTGFEYPERWVQTCTTPALLGDVARGLAVLTASGTVLRRGFTTGTTAAAACKAAVLSLGGTAYDWVPVTIPAGLTVDVPVSAREGTAVASKFAGDYPGDLTAGLCFHAVARPAEEIRIIPGEGIGRFSRGTPRFRKGDPAISPPAQDCIGRSIRDACDACGLPGAEVTLAVPGGAEVGRMTLNPRVGVVGGISILGTTGLVEPWDDHLGESVRERVASAPRVVLTTGRTGLRYARLLFPDHEPVLAGARLEEALGAARGDVILCGLPGLILRFCDPEILSGTGCVTVEELVPEPVFPERFDRAVISLHKRYPGIRIVCVDRSGRVIGDSG